MPRPRKPAASRPTSRTPDAAGPDRTLLDRDAAARVDAVTEQARRALAASLDRVVSSELDRMQKKLADSLIDFGIETVAPELAGLARDVFGGDVLGDALAGSLGAALPGILRNGTVAPGAVGRASVSATQRGSLSRAQAASATLRNLGKGGSGR